MLLVMTSWYRCDLQLMEIDRTVIYVTVPSVDFLQVSSTFCGHFSVIKLTADCLLFWV